MNRFVPIALFLLTAPAFAAPVPKVVLTVEQEKEFNQLWNELGKRASNEVRYYCRLVQHPEAAVAYLGQTIKPAHMTEKEGKQLIADLDSKDEDVRIRAYIDLCSRDIRLSMPLSEAWKLAKSDAQKYLLANSYWGRPMPPSLDGLSATLSVPKRFLQDDVNEWRVAITRKGEEIDSHRIPETFDEGVPTSWREYPPTRVASGLFALELINTPAARKHLEALAGGRERARTSKAAGYVLHHLEDNQIGPPKSYERLWQRPLGEFTAYRTTGQLLLAPKETVTFFKEKLRPVKLTNDEAKKLLAQLFSDDKKEVLAAVRELQVVDLQLEMDFDDIWKEAKTATHRCRLVDAMMLWTDQPYNAIPDDYDIDKRNKLWDYEYALESSSHDPRRFATLRCVWRADVPKDRPGDKPGGQRIDLFTDNGETHHDRWYHEESAIYILDAIGTDDAIALIKDMATGHPDAGPTKAAKDVLKRRGVK